jgi:hypothetical protein
MAELERQTGDGRMAQMGLPDPASPIGSISSNGPLAAALFRGVDAGNSTEAAPAPATTAPPPPAWCWASPPCLERSEAGDGAHIVANLPYNVGTALLLRWLAGPWPPWWRSLTLMFQREVAERIVASAGGDHYGRLAIAAQWRADARIALPVHRSAFTPPPSPRGSIPRSSNG